MIGTSRVIVSALAPGYRLILIDMRGHGASDKPHEAHAYALDRCVGDVVAVMDALARQGAFLELFDRRPDRIRHDQTRRNRLVTGGMHPYACDMDGFCRLFRKGVAEGGAALFLGAAGPTANC